MKKFLKLIGIPFVIALAIFLFIRFVWLRGFEFKNMTVEEYVTFYNSNGEGIIFVTKKIEESNENDGFDENAEFEEVIGKNFEAKNIGVYKLDLTNASGDEEQKFIDANEFTSEEFVMPMLIYVKDGTIIDVIGGYAPDYVMSEFITRNNIE